MIEKTVFSVAEVAGMFEVNESKIRYYVDRFNIDVPKKSNKLAFRQKHIDKLKKLTELIDNEQYTLSGAAATLRNRDEEDAYIAEVLDKLKHVKRVLITLKNNL